ncbi:hypothetical protein B0H15DRAFT_931268 [Mycena belliarum]|uniref:Uncharacterized protein n=1 Tax=Mycena belliarum TaxID=1033014 RepID=A0AAD6XRE0_9AGAR|nr:hypothetical protein B0H15DRAFT_931268 [Mycena belliae]
MAKPTLLQSLLGRPSQKYSLPAPKQYYSDRPAMMRIAAALDIPHDAPPTDHHDHHHDPDDNDDDDEDGDGDEPDVFYTPRSSVASDASMALTITTPPTSDAGHTANRDSLYTDEDWVKDIHWLATAIQKPPKRHPIPPPPPPPPRLSRTQPPSIMMSMTTLLEQEDEDAPPVPPKLSAPPSSVIVSARGPSSRSSRSSRAPSPPAAASHRRARSHGTASTSSDYYVPPPPPSGPPELPSYGTPAYTSLTIPAAPTPSRPLSRSGSLSTRIRASLRRETVDLSRSRLAQATMASVEVVGGLASHSYAGPPRLGFTHYRPPPQSVPKASVLVQVWAVGLDAVDLHLLGAGNTANTGSRVNLTRTRSRTQSFGRFVGRTMSISRRTASDSGSMPEFNDKEKDRDAPHAAPQVGFIPGRSFVGRVLECGWEVRDEVARRGEWVVGLLDVRKSGALAEFIVVDRHRIHRVPYPHTQPSTAASSPSSSAPSSLSSSASTVSSSRRTPGQNRDSPYPPRPSSVSFRDIPPPPRSGSHHSQHKRFRSAPPPPPPPPPGLTLTELALLPLGLAAHRAVRTLAGIEASAPSHTSEVKPGGELEENAWEAEDARPAQGQGTARRRALVLQGHAGTGGLVARMLVQRGWRVCVHAPGSLACAAAGSFSTSASASAASCAGGEDAEPKPETDEDRAHMRAVQARVRGWGVEEVVFDDGGAPAEHAAGGASAREGAAVRAVERLVADGDVFDAVVDTVGGRAVWEAGERLLAGPGGSGRKQFTTTVGDCAARPVPTAGDNFRAGLRALRGNAQTSGAAAGKAGKGKSKGKGKGKGEKGENEKRRSEVAYAWVSAAQDVDWEGADVRDALGALVQLALRPPGAGGVRPVGEAECAFERAGEVFEAGEGCGDTRAAVMRGGSVVVRVVE